MKILVINSAPYTGEFVEPIVKALANAGVRYELAQYDTIPEKPDRYRGLIISASPRGDNIVYDHLPYYQWIKDFASPILGICHGHQLIGVLHGSRLIRGEQGEDGVHCITIEKDSPLFAGLENNFKVEQHHEDCITLPDGFRLLASSTKCRVQAMVHRQKPIYTVQFHAENHSEILLNFVKIVTRANRNNFINQYHESKGKSGRNLPRS
jgi:GMP synthase (glutamine-hydrolysing)